MEASTRILSLALEGLYVERRKLDEEIEDVKRRLGSSEIKAESTSRNLRAKRASTKSNTISEAMKKHWIERRRRMSKKSG